MGFGTQRQYQTSIKSYEDAKEAVWRNREQVTYWADEKGNFTSYLKKYPDVRIQITSRQHFLKLHGQKPEEFLLDLKVILKLTSLLKEFYPHGIDFKLDKETYSWRDKDEVVDRKNGVIQMQRRMLNMALDDPKKYKHYIETIWKELEIDNSFRSHFAETLNHCFADLICRNGFRCKPDGSIRFLAIKGREHVYPMLEQYVRILQKSGFLED